MPKNVNTALKAKAKAWTFEAKAKATGPEAKAKAIKFGLEAPRGQGLASKTTSLCFCTCSTNGHRSVFPRLVFMCVVHVFVGLVVSVKEAESVKRLAMVDV